MIVCWNCGEEGHPCTKCNRPKNQDAIDKAKKKFEDEKYGRNNTGGGCGRKKWGVKNNDDVVPEPTIAPEGGNIAGSEGATHPPASTNIASDAKANQVVIDKDQSNQILLNLECNSGSPGTVGICAVLCTLFSLD